MTGRELTAEAQKIAESAIKGRKGRSVLVALVEDEGEGLALFGSKSKTRDESRKELIAFLRNTLNVLEGN